MSVLFTKRGTPPSLGKKASDYAVGESVFLPVNGTNTEFLVVHQGNPDTSIYDGSCDGTWLLMKTPSENNYWDANRYIGDYENSQVRHRLEGNFYAGFSEISKAAIKEVKIPYRPGTSGRTCNYGQYGLVSKVFLLSAEEVGVAGDPGSAVYLPISEGALLDYFDSGNTTSANAKRVAISNGSAVQWWLRSPTQADAQAAVYIDLSGWLSWHNVGVYADWYRPALIIDSATLFDPDTNIIKG